MFLLCYRLWLFDRNFRVWFLFESDDGDDYFTADEDDFEGSPVPAGVSGNSSEPQLFSRSVDTGGVSCSPYSKAVPLGEQQVKDNLINGDGESR